MCSFFIKDSIVAKQSNNLAVLTFAVALFGIYRRVNWYTRFRQLFESFVTLLLNQEHQSLSADSVLQACTNEEGLAVITLRGTYEETLEGNLTVLEGVAPADQRRRRNLHSPLVLGHSLPKPTLKKKPNPPN